MMRRCVPLATAAAGLALAVLAAPAGAIDRPFGTSRLYSPVYDGGAFAPAGGGGLTGGDPFSKTQIQAFRCASAGNPSATVDMSCNTTEYGQSYAPDNEIAVAVNPA